MTFASAASACPPTPGLGNWRGPCFNCYNYAVDVKGEAFFAQPGGWVEQFPFNSADIIAKAQADGLTYIDTWSPGDPPPVCAPGCLVAAAIIPANFPLGDFHWYRLNLDGSWSHKSGEAPARIFKNGGVNVSDPATADRGPYIEFVGYFCVPDPPPALSPGVFECETAPAPRAIALQYAGIENPVAYLPSSSVILPYLPGGGPIPDPEWPDHTLLPDHFGGYAFLPEANAGLPFAYLRVFQGVVALYSDLDGTNITYYVDDNGLGDFLASTLSPTIPTVSEWGLVVLSLLLLTAGTIVSRRHRRSASGASATEPAA